MRKVVVGIFAVLFTIGMLTSGILSAENNQNEKNAIRIINEQCSVCHTTKKIEQKQGVYDLKKWEKTIERMVKKGAKINQEENKIIAEYLAGFKI